MLPSTPTSWPVCGGVYWIEPTEAPAAAPNFRHPHVVIQSDELNRSRIETVVVCALSSNLQRGQEPGNVLLDAGEANLPKRSVIVVSQVSCVPKARLGAYVGQLSPARVSQIFDGLRFQQRTFFGDR